jgi:hypothetical protein
MVDIVHRIGTLRQTRDRLPRSIQGENLEPSVATEY